LRYERISNGTGKKNNIPNAIESVSPEVPKITPRLHNAPKEAKNNANPNLANTNIDIQGERNIINPSSLTTGFGENNIPVAKNNTNDITAAIAPMP